LKAPYWRHGEESRHSEKAGKSAEIQGAKL
jgi:hypothetical protein